MSLLVRCECPIDNLEFFCGASEGFEAVHVFVGMDFDESVLVGPVDRVEPRESVKVPGVVLWEVADTVEHLLYSLAACPALDLAEDALMEAGGMLSQELPP